MRFSRNFVRLLSTFRSHVFHFHITLFKQILKSGRLFSVPMFPFSYHSFQTDPQAGICPILPQFKIPTRTSSNRVRTSRVRTSQNKSQKIIRVSKQFVLTPGQKNISQPDLKCLLLAPFFRSQVEYPARILESTATFCRTLSGMPYAVPISGEQKFGLQKKQSD